ncbi:MAG TPA: DUF4367 domain-containing protein [Candidatus Saccharimonadales bacterium]|jgi:hypothetical protein|nr:DUF4367 domain-containing protein [Candidatus Saccharimonadales bacterium]
MSQQTVTINGIIYDAQTGLQLRKAPEAVRSATPRAHHSQNMHKVTQKSATLNRAFVKKAAPVPVTHQVITKPAQTAKPNVNVQKSPAITRFAPHPTGAKPSVRHMDIGPKSHPIAAKAQAKMQTTATPAIPMTHAVKPSHVIKNEAISEAMEKAPKHTANAKQFKQPRKHSRTLSLMSASLALMMLAGYFTYLNMPNLSVRVAAAQAGFDATYPGYQPDGYRINKVAYNEGQVGIQFVANGSDQGFTVKQEKSSWDSSALLENYVQPTSHGGYIPHSEQGITVYVFDNNAAWVNDGIRYTIDGNAPLSSEQVLNIATSM